MRVRLTAELDPKAKRKRPDLKMGATYEKARPLEAVQNRKNHCYQSRLYIDKRTKRFETDTPHAGKIRALFDLITRIY